MKQAYGLLLALLIGTAAMAQPTPHEKEVLKNDLATERNKRHEVARDIFHGQPAKARADHRTAVAYHKKIHRDARRIQHNDAKRHRYYAHKRRHHYRH